MCIRDRYIGGKEKNKHQSKKTEGTQGRSTKTKTPVVGLVERGGNIVTHVVKSTGKKTMETLSAKHIKKGAMVSTDEYKSYNGLSEDYNHMVVNHGDGEYVVGEAHTNTVECFWSQMKRGIIGIYHKTSTKHLQAYADEFSLRFNTRHDSESERFNGILRKVGGKRLTYDELTAKSGNLNDLPF